MQGNGFAHRWIRDVGRTRSGIQRVDTTGVESHCLSMWSSKFAIARRVFDPTCLGLVHYDAISVIVTVGELFWVSSAKLVLPGKTAIWGFHQWRNFGRYMKPFLTTLYVSNGWHRAGKNDSHQFKRHSLQAFLKWLDLCLCRSTYGGRGLLLDWDWDLCVKLIDPDDGNKFTSARRPDQDWSWSGILQYTCFLQLCTVLALSLYSRLHPRKADSPFLIAASSASAIGVCPPTTSRASPAASSLSNSSARVCAISCLYFVFCPLSAKYALQSR